MNIYYEGIQTNFVDERIKQRHRPTISSSTARRGSAFFVCGVYFPLCGIVEGRNRVANRPGMPGTVPELMSGVPYPRLGHVCPGIY